MQALPVASRKSRLSVNVEQNLSASRLDELQNHLPYPSSAPSERLSYNYYAFSDSGFAGSYRMAEGGTLAGTDVVTRADARPAGAGFCIMAGLDEFNCFDMCPIARINRWPGF